MNRTKLKNYAPQARRDFIAAVTDRAARLGIQLEKGTVKVEPFELKGDVAMLSGQALPRKVAGQRQRLEERIERDGFGAVMEAMAYTWFNRLVAIRFMELHDYLDHGFRVLSHPAGGLVPEILAQAEHVELPGLDRGWVIDAKLAGDRDEELYRRLLIAQCNALSEAMPFLFERIDDETELLLPDNLLHSDSLIRKLVATVPEEDWAEIEIVGWLYQFYISEKKDQVIGKVVRSEDIPAATQLFTPNWIVKYLLENSLGRMWLATYPDSDLKGQMPYYIEPAEQTEEVQRQLAEITPTSLDPETITVMDPACGSGHMLVEAYDLMKAIYQERGYRSRDIPALILEKNLYGLDIDDRAAQLAAFALMMKARADDRRIFERGVQPNVLAIQESKGLDAKDLAQRLVLVQDVSTGEDSPFGGDDMFPETVAQPLLSPTRKTMFDNDELTQTLTDLLALFEHGKTFGSLISLPDELKNKLPKFCGVIKNSSKNKDLFSQPAGEILLPFIRQSLYLVSQYDIVVTNPPYMGNKGFNPLLKGFINKNFSSYKGDLYSCFIKSSFSLTKNKGFSGMITFQNWMFLSSFEKLREEILLNQTIDTFVHNGRGVWGSDFGSCSFILRNFKMNSYKGAYFKLFKNLVDTTSNDILEKRYLSTKPYFSSTINFRSIPGNPIAYWVSDTVRSCFKKYTALEKACIGKHGMSTSDNDRFLRLWHEVNFSKLGLNFNDRKKAKESSMKWFPFNKGGAYRKWYGNYDYVVNWEKDGQEIKEESDKKYPYLKGKLDFVIGGQEYYFKEGITWTSITLSKPSFRFLDNGFVIGNKGQTLYPNHKDKFFNLIGFLNSKISENMLAALSPTVGFELGYILKLPAKESKILNVDFFSNQAINLAKSDWNSFEISWDFQELLWLISPLKAENIEQSWHNWVTYTRAQIAQMQELETENNRLFIEAYGLEDELTPEVPEDQITLARADRTADIKRLISYAIGCMMGRYSLDRPGLIYAHAGNEGFDPDQYPSFPADDDGIIPLTEIDWFTDDAGNRLVEFLRVVWGPETLSQNLAFIAESLDPKRGETPADTLRRYLANKFYKDHLQTYKRRPIYWLFSSGKLCAFQALVYLHRYNASTLARMRVEYVIPLQGRINARLEQLRPDIDAATSTAARKKLEKERETLQKHLEELIGFDDRLRHFADQRISLDLDDGVKVNYGKFSDPKYGGLLAEVKAVTGNSE